jgi:DNA-binding HxlR family transcriptional regulator
VIDSGGPRKSLTELSATDFSVRYNRYVESRGSEAQTPAFQRLAQIMGCKWSMGILDSIDRGISRPSRIEKELDGISERVLHRCINRLENEGFLVRESFDEIPPRVEYRFSEEGRVLMEMIQSVRSLASRWTALEPMQL